jgi:hypothetical protein
MRATAHHTPPSRRAAKDARAERAKRRRALSEKTNEMPEPASVAVKTAQPKVPKTPKESFPPGWVRETSTTSGETYYRNVLTQQAQWEVPKQPATSGVEAVERAHATMAALSTSGIRVVSCVGPARVPRSHVATLSNCA